MYGVAGVRWGEVLLVLQAVDPWHLGLLAVVWLGGLGVYSIVLATALPGLGMRRGLVLNLSGSAVANTVPLGGAVATALNWRMVRAWGHSNPAFVAFCVLTNALDVATKLLLPMAAVATLTAMSLHVPRVLWILTGTCVAAFAVVALARTMLLGSRAQPRRGLRVPAAVQAYLRDSGSHVRALVERGWTRLVPASLGYVTAQVLLLFLALRAVGLDAPVTVVLTAAAIERLGTLIPLTPGGTGFAEVGTIAWLVSTGQDPVEVVAGVLLYRMFLVVMEIPVGAILLGGWAWTHRQGARRPEGHAPPLRERGLAA